MNAVVFGNLNIDVKGSDWEGDELPNVELHEFAPTQNRRYEDC